MNQLEETFQRIMNDYGHDVLIVHNDKDEICSCYDPATGSVLRACPYCFGTGHVAQIKKYRTRHLDANVPESNVYLNTPRNFSEISTGAKIYFFYKDQDIRVGDLIVEVDWEGIRPVYKGGSIYEIAHTHENRYLNGEVLYYKTFTKEQPINKSIRGFQVVKRAGEVQYQLAEGKGHQIIDPNAKQNPAERIQFDPSKKTGGPWNYEIRPV